MPDTGHIAEQRPRHVPAAKVAALVDDYIYSADARPWNSIHSFPWNEIQPQALTQAHRSAVCFVTMIEDHIPGYYAEVFRRYPLDESCPLAEFMHNRELFRFYARWAHEEEAHAHVLFRYQVLGKLAEPEELRARLATIGRARFELPGQGPVAALTYAAIQEKATQLFYQQFASSVRDPVLANILRTMSRDEARHYAFFSKLLGSYIEQFGSTVLPDIELTLKTFRMPLAHTIKNYWRWSIEIADGVGGYNHTQAYPALLKILKRIDDPSVRERSKAIEAFISSVCQPSNQSAHHAHVS